MRVATATVAVFALLGSVFAFGTVASAVGHCGPDATVIACENSKPGTSPNVWDIDGAGDSSIQGFATDISVNVGSRIDFKIDTNASSYTIDIYRTGYYQGLGARFITAVTPSVPLPQNQPECLTEAATALYDCGTWRVSASWNVPSDAVSGVYIALLSRGGGAARSHITFVVRDDSSTSDILFQTSDPTWQAYNSYGGASTYGGGQNGRAYKVSYNRPFATRSGLTARDFYFSGEYAMVRFIERNGYDVSYASGIDTDRNGANLLKHRVFLSVGHDEYWSGAQRANMEAARDAGVNLQFLTGNEGYWRMRYEPSPSEGTAYRTLVTYKETLSNAKIDPSPEWTGTSRDPRFAPQSAGAGRPENNLTGTMYMVNSVDLPVTVSSAEGKTRLWRNTSLTSLATGTKAELARSTVGYESNEDIDNGFRPEGLIRLSTTTGYAPEYLQDYGSIVRPGTTTHNTTLYRARSGALVFSTGSIQWSWGLDQTHDGDGAPADSRMQQAQVNLFADMGAQPSTLMSGLVATQASSDRTPPTVSITSPAQNSTISNGSLVTVSGTAADVGGVVAGVEVSTDGGARWHPAQGTTNWSYSYGQRGSGTQSIRVRAIDDSANYPSTPASVVLSVPGPYSAFGNDVPKVVDSGDGAAVELGLRFSPEVGGFVTGVRFYKSAANLGVHTGSLWSSAGTRLATVTFSGETAAGWQTAKFSSAVAVAAGQTYVVSYTAPRGRYSLERYYWPYSATTTSPLSVTKPFGQPLPGVYGTAGQFPSESFENSNYFVDALFDSVDTTPLAATTQWPQPGMKDVPVNTDVSAAFSSPVVANSVTATVANPAGTNVVGTTSYNATTRTVQFTPSAALAGNTTYTVTLDAVASTGGSLVTGRTWSFTTVDTRAVGDCPCSLFPGAVPTVLETADPGPVTLGVRFTALSTGTITGMKFYKGLSNTGTHTGTLWTASGQSLGTATFSNESASGWQFVNFAQPIAVQAGSDYVASYRANVGAYSSTVGAFTGAGFERGPLAVGTSAGLYTYGNGVPTSTSTTNYFVDVVFASSGTPTPLSVVSSSPTAGQTEVPQSAVVSAVLSAAPSEPPTLTVSSSAGPVIGTVGWNATTRTITFTPSSPLAASTPYTAQVAVAGTPVTGGSFSFTTAATTTTTGQFTLLGDQAPTTAASTDPDAVELGMAFTVSQPGTVTGIRFFKGTGNSGTHRGTLWSSAGQNLASVTFTNETATGWQTANLQSPVTLTVGQRYVVSYLAPNGRYALTSNYFNTPRTNGPITADTTSNGRYRYGSTGGFPTASWNASNYFVDIVFVTGGTVEPVPVSVTSTSPTAGQTNVTPSITVSAGLSADSATGTPALALTSAAGGVAGVSTYNAQTRTVSFTPNAVLAWSTQYTAAVTIGGSAVAGGNWSFTTAAAPVSGGEVFTLLGTQTPQVAAEADTSAVELGMAFTVSQAGQATGVRFYKGSGNGGTHVGSLWSATGQRLASVTFTGETATGWQSASFASPVNLAAGSRYVVSYLAPQGRYAATANYFTTQRTSGPLTADTTNNGRYLYGSAGGYPTGTWNATNYFVDVTFTTTTSTPTAVTVTSTTPASGATGVAPTTTVTAQLANVGTRTPTLALAGPSGAVAGATNWNATAGTLTFTPSTALTASTTYTATVSIDGTVLAGSAWSFTTAAATPTAVTVTSTTPASGATGVAPTTTVTAQLANVGTRTPTLALAGPSGAVAGATNWNATAGTLTFTPSTALTASTTYTATVSIDGTVLAGSAWSFTTAAATPTAVTVTSTTPASGATGVAPTTTVTAQLANVGTRTPTLALAGPSGAVAGATNWNATAGTLTFTPSTPLAWSASYTAAILIDGTALTGGGWSFTTAAVPPTVAVTTIFPENSTPVNANWDDPNAVQVGTRFQTSVAGTITGIRYYKGALNTGTHTGYLWNAAGQRLAQISFTNETASGWQVAMLSTAVAIVPGVEYRVSLHSTTGRYAVDLNGLSATISSGPLTTFAPGGAYTYSTNYPGTVTTHNFWVDALFAANP
ncbi:hypothetical protein ABIB15_002302 [Marisediminicola sp. UYEF4]|uniref:DUF4082 domain-containing protein n=1 Tax=Marisediminicola sp. UYEF4 TaxID=1756384 RepID=UPI00339314F9